jgi:ribosomal protein L37AE/L43A
VTTLAYPIATEAEFPDGLWCGECGRALAGQAYTDKVEGMQGEDVSVVLVCVYC